MKRRPSTYKERQDEMKLLAALNDYCEATAHDLLSFPPHEIPEDLKERIEHQLYARVHKRRAFRRIRRIGNIAAIVLLAALLISAILCLSVTGLRQSLTDWLMEYNGYTAMELPGGKVYAFSGNRTYHYVGGRIDDDVETCILQNQEGQEVTVLRQPFESVGALDTEDASISEQVSITPEITGIYIEKADMDGNDVHILWWTDGQYSCHITGDFSREEMLQVAQDVCANTRNTSRQISGK